MTKATNADEFAEAMGRTQARKDALDALPPEAHSFLNALKDRWFPMGKTEDYALIQRMLVDAWVKP
jgi:hypothetical protein